MRKVSQYRSPSDISASLLLLLSEEESLNTRLSYAEENLTEKLQSLYGSEGKDDETRDILAELEGDIESVHSLRKSIVEYRDRLLRFESLLRKCSNAYSSHHDSILVDSANSALVSVGTRLLECDRLQSESDLLCDSKSEFLAIAIDEIGETWSEMREGSVEEVKLLVNELSAATFDFSNKEEAQSVTHELQKEKSQVDAVVAQSETLLTLLKKIMQLASELPEELLEEDQQQGERLIADIEEQNEQLEQQSDTMQEIIISIRVDWKIL